MLQFKKIWMVLAFGICFHLACTKKRDTTTTTTNITTPGTLTLSSSAFTNNGRLPIIYTCDGSSVSPPIAWTDVPAGTMSYAVTMHHVPASGEKHVYLLLYNLSNTIANIAANTSGIGIFGINTVNGKQSYSPPCSQGPGDKLYTLTVYALSAAPKFTVAASTVTMDMFLEAIKTTT